MQTCQTCQPVRALPCVNLPRMKSKQLGARFDVDLVERVAKAAAVRGMTERTVVQACLEAYLPVIEAGLHGNPVGEPLLAQWAADLEEARGRLAAATASPSRSARPRTKAA